MVRPILFITLASLLGSVSAFAEDAGSIESFQMPAWLERDGEKQALRAGTALQSGDIVSTGNNARILISLEEGSKVKLGENAELDLSTLKAPDKKDGVFEGFMNVIRGAFRFTTTLISENRSRDIGVRIGVVTAGIRGTDIWGSSKSDKDVLCLIEGNITAQRDGDAEFTMDEPLSFFVVPKDEPAKPVERVPTDQLTQWATETELKPEGGTINSDGRWAANLMSVSGQTTANNIKAALEKAGYATEIAMIEIEGSLWFRIRIEGFVSQADAKAFASDIDGQMGIKQPWVGRF